MKNFGLLFHIWYSKIEYQIVDIIRFDIHVSENTE